MEKNTPQLSIINQYIKDFSLEIPFAPEIFKELTSAPKVNIDVNIESKHLEGSLFNVGLKVNMSADINEKKLFIIELEYACLANVVLPEENMEPALLVSIPQLLFPYARSIISNNLMDAGLPPLMLNPIDFVQMYNNRKAKN